MHCSFSGCPALEELDIHQNDIRALPEAIGQLHSLKKLDVSENNIAQLELSICDCAKLDKLELKQIETKGFSMEGADKKSAN